MPSSDALRYHFRVGLSSVESRITSVKDGFTNTSTILGLRKIFTRQRLYIIFYASSTLLLGVTTTWLVGNYRLYRKLFTKDAPMKLGLWAAALILKPFGRETTSTEEYEGDYGKAWLVADDDSVLIPERKKVRPKTGWHFLPHRQIEARPEPGIAVTLERRFKEIAAVNNIYVKVAPSPHEGTIDALVISDFIPRETWHPVAKYAWGEIAHIHTDKDKSLHVVLSPQDCKIAIERGWGERHPISGVVGLPKEYLMIYAPMDEDEVEVVVRIIKASIAYMTGREVV